MSLRARPGDGFTLVELLAVVAVACTLMLIALPSYLDRMVRQQVAEALPLADLPKPAIEAAWKQGQGLPADNEAAGMPAAEKIVNAVVGSVRVENGAIHIAFGNKAHASLKGKTLTVRPAVVEDARIVPVAWLCGRAVVPDRMTGMGENRTDVPAALLPVKCR